MADKPLIQRGLYLLRNVRYGAVFAALRRVCRGDVLDVGGWDFFLAAKARGVPFDTWTVLEPAADRQVEPGDARFRFVCGDGAAMPFADRSFDTVLVIHILEHVFEPLAVLRETARVLRPGGHVVLLVPQTAVMHEVPRHYYNFTRFWVREALGAAGLGVELVEPLGGFWSTVASRLVHLPLQAARYPGYSTAEVRRGAMFYALLPAMAAWTVVSLPAALVLSLGDLREEANNILAVAGKGSGRAG